MGRQANNLMHGMYYTRTYMSWKHMLERCLQPNCKDYADYADRGITINNAWKKFENFFSDMGECPGKGWSLDRIENNKGYDQGNCRWATAKIQQNNKRNNRYVFYNNKVMSVIDVSKLESCTDKNVYYRLDIGKLKEVDRTGQPVNHK